MKTGEALLVGGIAGAAYSVIRNTWPTADAKLSYKASSEQLNYMKERDRIQQANLDLQMSNQRAEDQADRWFKEEQAKEDRYRKEVEASNQRLHEMEMQKAEHEMRQEELRVQEAEIDSRNNIAMLNAQVAVRNADLDREAQLAMHAKTLDQQLLMHSKELDKQEYLELRRLRVQRNLAEQNEELQKFLLSQGFKNTQEIEKFKALAIRETQILLARENAQNILQDKLVQDALKTFPLNISPLVLLKNQQHTLTGLLRFSTIKENQSQLPDITQVYRDVQNYSMNPEALNIFIAPLHISSSIKNRETLNKQIWDLIYQKVETFFTTNYNRRGDHPVILYPTAWKDNSEAGQHASETLHFFLKDIPCLVVEPRFDGHSLNIVFSGWNNGYLSSDHVRTQMYFDVNLHGLIMQAAYERSKKSLSVLEALQDNLSNELSEKKLKLERNIEYYEKLNLAEKIKENNIEEIEALGVYELFDIDSTQDLQNVADKIASVICLNLAILSDVHHLQSTDALPLFIKLFKEYFPELYSDKELRKSVSQCYEEVYKYLRKHDAEYVSESNKREIERVRELQIENLKKELELIDKEDILNSIDEKIKIYASERYREIHLQGEELWMYVIEHMTQEDTSFFKEILPNIEDRRMYKRIDKKIGELHRN